MKNLTILLLVMSNVVIGQPTTGRRLQINKTTSTLSSDSAITFNTTNSPLRLGASEEPECGTWEKDEPQYLEWKDAGKIGNRPDSGQRDWVESEPKAREVNYMPAVYYPCGNPQAIIYDQYRVCCITGIQQHRTIIEGYKYIPKPKSEYQKAVEALRDE
jgi:hypothetical protein